MPKLDFWNLGRDGTERRPYAGRARPRPQRRARRPASRAEPITRREPSRAEGRLSSSAAFAPRRQPGAWSLLRPRPGPLAVAFLITLVWFLANVRRLSPLDVLPFAWTWLTLWLACSIAFELWRRYGQSRRRQRRHLP